MTYQKPAVIEVATAITAIQDGMSKNDAITDNNHTLPSVDAYQADE